MSVRDALALLTGGEASNDVLENIIKAIEEKCGHKAVNTANLHKAVNTANLQINSIPGEKKIQAIKILRQHTGWSLRESKDFIEVVSGIWSCTTGTYVGGKPNILNHDKSVIENVYQELFSIGCETQII